MPRLLALVRNPVDRAWSQYNHSVDRGDEHRSFGELVEAELAADPSDWRTSGGCLARGRYIDHLRQLADYFDRAQIHVGLFDELVAEPHAFYAAVCRFLEVDSSIVPTVVGQVFDPREIDPRTARPTRTRLPETQDETMPQDVRRTLLEYFRPYHTDRSTPSQAASFSLLGLESHGRRGPRSRSARSADRRNVVTFNRRIYHRAVFDEPRSTMDEAAPTAPGALPTVGVVSAWFDPEDPRVWSGVPRGLVNELRRLGVYGGNRSATTWPKVSRLVLRWMQLTDRANGWTRRREMRILTRVSDARLRLTTPRDFDGWIHLVGGNGPVSRGRYVTLFEMSPTQLLEASPRWAPSFGYPYATRRQMVWVARRQVALYDRAYACCVASRWAADSLIRDHGIDARRVHVVGYGRNANIPPPADRDWSMPRFLFVGRDWARKNGDAVVRAFVKLRKEIPEARLDLVGDHPAIDAEGVVEHGLIGVHEPSGRARIESLFGSATCFVLPSFMEPFGIVYVEAAAAGLASIGTSIGGTADSVGTGGILVDPYDEDGLHGAMRELSHPETAQALGAVARERAGALTWSAMGQRVLRSLDLGPIPRVTLAEYL